MGHARDAFGTGVAAGSGTGGAASPAGRGAAGSGAAADGFLGESAVIDGHVAALGEHDGAAAAQTHGALAAAGVGRQQMDAVIDAAVADVAAMGMSTGTPQGKRALVAAIRRRLDETQATVRAADADAQTRAAGANVAAAGYDGLGRGISPAGVPMPTSTPPMMGGMPAMGGMPMMGGGGIPPMMGGGGGMAGGNGAGPLSGLVSLAAAQPHSTEQFGADDGQGAADSMPPRRSPVGSPLAAIDTGDVRFERMGLPGGRHAYRQYISQALDVMGITDPGARANWTRGLEVGLSRESAFNADAVNRWDSNARGAIMADGAPAQSSRGGLQTIPTTFAAHHQPGTTTNIYDPVANTAAAMNYLMRRYHVSRDGSNLSAVPQFNPNHQPQGY